MAVAQVLEHRNAIEKDLGLNLTRNLVNLAQLMGEPPIADWNWNVLVANKENTAILQRS